MPARYVHLGAADLYEQVLRDAGVDPQDNRIEVQPVDELARWRSLVKRERVAHKRHEAGSSLQP